MKVLNIVLLFTLTLACTSKNKYHKMNTKLNFYTQYHQFYIAGGISPTELNDNGYEERLGIYNNFLIVYTECYGPVKGEISILKERNDSIDYRLYDHIVEGGLTVTNGKIQILDCPNDSIELEIPVKSSTYRVRIYSSNLSSVDGDEGEDFYKIEIWEDDNLERKVLKNYNSTL